MNEQRILQLADAVERIQHVTFDMSVWCRISRPCGMSLCMGGIAAALWPEELELVRIESDRTGSVVRYSLQSVKSQSGGCEAMAEVLGITIESSRDIFSNIEDERPLDRAYHAARLRQFVAQRSTK